MNVVFFLEERSAREMLQGLLPKLMRRDIPVIYVVFEGMHDMEKNIVRKLRGWRTPDTMFVILRDQDRGDCKAIKRGLQEKCRTAGRSECIVRIACRKLESWYFGDLGAVERGLALSDLVKYEKKKKYRNPDSLTAPAEELEKITGGRYQKVQGSRSIGKELVLEGNRSRSFAVFLETVQQLFG